MVLGKCVCLARARNRDIPLTVRKHRFKSIYKVNK